MTDFVAKRIYLDSRPLVGNGGLRDSKTSGGDLSSRLV